MVSYQVNPFLEVAQRRAGDAYLARSDRGSAEVLRCLAGFVSRRATTS
jgi:hypothetical protein